jgi:hypothetical protein
MYHVSGDGPEVADHPGFPRAVPAMLRSDIYKHGLLDGYSIVLRNDLSTIWLPVMRAWCSPWRRYLRASLRFRKMLNTVRQNALASF